MNSQFKIFDEKWDILIVLDACRYDYFELCFREYFTGKLQKKYSSGASTVEWRNNNFKTAHKDTVYVSSNPYISNCTVNGFNGNGIFYVVYDVWKSAWNQNLGTVKPNSVSNIALDAINTHPNKKFIIHYLQPHAPYLSLKDDHGFISPSGTKPFIINEQPSTNGVRQRALDILRTPLSKLKFINNHLDWFLAQALGLPPQTPMDYVRRKYGTKALRTAYKDNLRLVLFETAYLVSHISSKKKIVITSDHGELLGERGLFAHPYGSMHKTLRHIPWFEVEQVNEIDFSLRNNINHTEKDDELSIEKKLKDLGYF